MMVAEEGAIEGIVDREEEKIEDAEGTWRVGPELDEESVAEDTEDTVGLPPLSSKNCARRRTGDTSSDAYRACPLARGCSVNAMVEGRSVDDLAWLNGVDIGVVTSSKR